MLAVSSMSSSRETATTKSSSLIPSTFILARSSRYHKCALFNVLPSDLTNESAFAGEKCRLFYGDVVLDEYIENGSSISRYILKFEWNRGGSRRRNVFCHTEVMDNVHKWNETITEWSSERFRIMMQCSDDRYILLELQICETSEDRKFRDVLCSISEEFEIWAELMDD
ncbi:hypothetical protein ZYGR_0A05150 [Zygosaccharomyces rouxii]|uniref:Uncharacterized protein n=1 Tax=Zygosaccharomyces rouxii TaxID=4956 RepID=A0A1Q2ZTW7_ZYGRO|nr:hypothetical protein ZYGR_0A05150 [Zygosaccharomyces rouxii]